MITRGRRGSVRQLQVLVCMGVLGLAVASLGEANDGNPPPFARLRAHTRATAERPPPSRDKCEPLCLTPSKYRTYEGFLRWAGVDAGALWRRIIREAGLPFTTARVVVVSGSVKHRTSCAVHPNLVREDAPIGPFYCSRDGRGTVVVPAVTTKKIVFDDALAFARDYRERDFAFAFVLAHEWGHHVQRLLQIRTRGVNNELQADCLAGIWAYSAWARSLLEAGDVQEAVRAASAIGDVPGVPPRDPDAHGTGEQRVFWFMRGYDSGRFDRCDTSSVSKRTKAGGV